MNSQERSERTEEWNVYVHDKTAWGICSSHTGVVKLKLQSIIEAENMSATCSTM